MTKATTNNHIIINCTACWANRQHCSIRICLDSDKLIGTTFGGSIVNLSCFFAGKTAFLKNPICLTKCFSPQCNKSDYYLCQVPSYSY